MKEEAGPDFTPLQTGANYAHSPCQNQSGRQHSYRRPKLNGHRAENGCAGVCHGQFHRTQPKTRWLRTPPLFRFDRGQGMERLKHPPAAARPGCRNSGSVYNSRNRHRIRSHILTGTPVRELRLRNGVTDNPVSSLLLGTVQALLQAEQVSFLRIIPDVFCPCHIKSGNTCREGDGQ